MPYDIHDLFTETDLNRIAEAVRRAERSTSGQIVPFVVERSDSYPEAAWRGATFGGAIGLLAVAILALSGILPTSPAFTLTVVVSVGSALLVAGAAELLDPVRRLAAGKHAIHHRTAQRAVEAFVSEEVFNTRERSGILLFLSLMERRAIVLGDSGVNARVRQEEWDSVLETITTGMRGKRVTEALVEAIRMCGELLEREGLPAQAGGQDELPDNLRIGRVEN